MAAWTFDHIPAALRLGLWEARTAQTAGGRITALPNRWPASGPSMAQGVAANQPLLELRGGHPAAVWPLAANNTSLIPSAVFAPAYWILVAQYGGGAADAMFPADAYPGLISDGGARTTTRVTGNAGTVELISSGWTGQAARNAGSYGAVILPLPMGLVELRGAPLSAAWSLGRGDRGADRGWRGTIWAAMALAAEPTGDLLARIQGRMAWDYGIQDKLPAGHPYRNAPPTITDGVASGGIPEIRGQASAIMVNAGRAQGLVAPIQGRAQASLLFNNAYGDIPRFRGAASGSLITAGVSRGMMAGVSGMSLASTLTNGIASGRIAAIIGRSRGSKLGVARGRLATAAESMTWTVDTGRKPPPKE